MRRTETVLIVTALAFLSRPMAAADLKPIETFTAFAASLGTGRASALTVTIDRWSTDQERDLLLTTLQEFGRDRLIDTLMKLPPVGYMRTPTSIGYDLYFARNNPAPNGGRRVVLATNRRVRFREAATSQRSLQYQLTVIELRLDATGKGEGKMVPAAKVSWNNEQKRIEIENYNALPVELLNVESRKP